MYSRNGTCWRTVVCFFEGVMLSYDIIIGHSQVINQGPSALLFFILSILQEAYNRGYRNDFLLSVHLSVRLFTEHLLKSMHDLMKLHSNVSLNETMCRIHDSATQTQGPDYSSRTRDLPLNFMAAPHISNPSNIFTELHPRDNVQNLWHCYADSRSRSHFNVMF